jgi:hypothetical protein
MEAQTQAVPKGTFSNIRAVGKVIPGLYTVKQKPN